MQILVDADSLVYLVGFAGQSSDYDCYILSGPKDAPLLVDRQQVKGLDEVAALEAQLADGEWLEREHIITEEPLVNVLANVKRSLLAIEHALRVDHKLSFGRMDLFLTGKGNHRNEYAKVKVYKGNRLDTPRPVHYEAIREYLVRRWDARVVDGCEADDIVSIIAAAHKYDPEAVCIVSCDKDLTTVPGRLYNFRRREMKVLSAADARLNFYRQLITGDATDNVPGCFRSGKAAAEVLVTQSMTEKEMARSVLAEYEASRTRKGCPYADREASDVMREMGILLHMQRREGEIWAIPALDDAE